VMCEYCDGKKAVKRDREAFVAIARTSFDGDVMVMQCLEVWRSAFGRPKYAHLLFDFPINYCPMCGRKLGGGE